MGFWSNGTPDGPFTTREFGSGHAFICVRIAYAASHDYRADATALSTRRRPGSAMRFGTCAIECAISGNYFRGFPHVTHLRPPMSAREDVPEGGVDTQEALADVEAAASAAAEAATAAAAMRGLGGGGLGESLRLLPCDLSELSADSDGITGAAGGAEGLVYVPGFNTPLDVALQSFGQLLATARLPATLKPLVLSWPGGRALSYLPAARASTQPWMAADLIALLTGMHEYGIRTVHLLTHSMGARCLLHALPALRAAPLLRSGALALGHVVLLSPDFPLRAFVETAAESLAALGATTTIYGDRHDRPLAYSELLCRLLGAADWRSLGRLQGAPWSGECDVDVVDTTWMQAGLPAGDPDLAVNTKMRHSQFAVNQLIAADIVELLTTGRRAAERGRLRRRAGTGGVYHFFSTDS